MTDDLMVGTMHVESERLKMFEYTSQLVRTCFEHPAWYPIRPGRFADVDAFEYHTHILLWMTRALAVSSVVEVLSRRLVWLSSKRA